MILGKIKKTYWYLELVPKLGISEVLYIVYYRILLKTGILVKKFPVRSLESIDKIFNRCSLVRDFSEEWKINLLVQADKIIEGYLPYYSFHWIKQSIPPNWFYNPFNGKECHESKKHWSKISDFNDGLGDIKNIWEISRFTWISILARAYVVTGNDKYINIINTWVSDWIKRNPVNQGPNWKCGQEASIRVLNLLNTAQILGQVENPSLELILFIKAHLDRIYLNFRYAFAQRNNHATSEAAALFIGGNWLEKVDYPNQKQYSIYAKKGRSALENLVKRLVYEDGSFSQHSINYHRLFLDTLTLIIFWTRKLEIQGLTQEFIDTAKKSVDWLLLVIDESGRCPNLGSNDGTMLLGNNSCDYRDYRPTLQTASVLIKGYLAFENGSWDEPLFWFGIRKNNLNLSPFKKQSKVCKSGYVIMNGENSWALLRFPFYKFRPSHNDIFHFDLWSNGRNLMFDSGSFSYFPDKDSEVPDLRSVHAHNTLSFDHQEQMPRIGRFLMAKWIKPLTLGNIIQSDNLSGMWEGSYRDSSGNLHLRKVKWNNNNWEIHDRFSGSAKYVEIGFNFSRCNYSIEDKTKILFLPWGKITTTSNMHLQIKEQIMSDYYFQSLIVYRLVITSQNNSEITTLVNIY